MMRARLQARADLYGHVRRFFAARDVLEVDTPLLSQAAVSDVHLASLATHIDGHGPYYLQTSPEYPMKRLLAAGVGDCYQICKVFRDGERGPRHNPEFTMLEWYRLGFDHHRLMDEVEALLQPVLARACPAAAVRKTYVEVFEEALGFNPETIDLDALRDCVARHTGTGWAEADRDTLLDALMGLVVGPGLGHDRLVFVTDYPASQAALARLLPTTPPRAARFEAYAHGLELCNGFDELTDAGEQRRRFSADLAARRAHGRPAVPLDERFLAALEQGLPPCAGVAVGLDRVLMVARGHARIDDVLAFVVEES